VEVLSSESKKNHLLAALPHAESQRWLLRLEPVDLSLGEVLYESGVSLSHVYFPTTAIISLLYVMENGASAEIAIVGNEGIVGISLFMGGESTTSRAVVQSAGKGFRLKARLMKQEFHRAGPALHLLLRYTQALITQMSQTAVCNRPRGQITVLDRAALEKRSCECYAVVKKEYDRLLPVKLAS
jgi:CRP-like cAMP-binding protein